MLDKDFFAWLRERHSSHVSIRRELIAVAADALSASKRAIFALHRDDLKEADKLLARAEDGFDRIGTKMSDRPELAGEGSVRAALEEYVEAALYRNFVKAGTIGGIKRELVDHDIYIGGLSDLTGELQRRQVRLATEGDATAVKALKDAIEAVVAELLAMDLEGYLRTKFDQAKNSLRRAEDVLYEVTLRRGVSSELARERKPKKK